MSTRPLMRDEPSVVRNYGNLLAELCGSVPDGVVVFFPSYAYLEKLVEQWDKLQILERIMACKLIFIETR